MKKAFLLVAFSAAAMFFALVGCNSKEPSEPEPFVSPLSPPDWIWGAWSYDSLTWVFSSDNALEIVFNDTIRDYKEVARTGGIISNSTLGSYKIYMHDEIDTSVIILTLSFAPSSDTTLFHLVAYAGIVPKPCTLVKQQ